MWGDSGRQGETRGDKTSGKADTPSNTGTYVARQWETMGDKGRQGDEQPTEVCYGLSGFGIIDHKTYLGAVFSTFAGTQVGKK